MSHPQIPMQKVIIGTANWDIHADQKGRLWSIPKPEIKGCESSGFGDKYHIKKLMANGIDQGQFTEAGLELMAGLHSVIHTDSHGKQFSVLRFH